MSKKVLILSGSPRTHGNSDLLCDQFLKGAVEAGHQAEKIMVREKKIQYCTGCGFCYNHQGKCSQKDDMAEILTKMIAADVIVMATPVYFYTMDGQMKTLIDRTCSGYTQISNKDFYFILAAATNRKADLERTVEEFRGFTMCLENPTEKGIIYGTNAWNIGDIKGSEFINQAYQMGKNV